MSWNEAKPHLGCAWGRTNASSMVPMPARAAIIHQPVSYEPVRSTMRPKMGVNPKAPSRAIVAASPTAVPD